MERPWDWMDYSCRYWNHQEWWQENGGEKDSKPSVEMFLKCVGLTRRTREEPRQGGLEGSAVWRYELKSANGESKKGIMVWKWKCGARTPMSPSGPVVHGTWEKAGHHSEGLQGIQCPRDKAKFPSELEGVGSIQRRVWVEGHFSDDRAVWG